MSARRVTGFTIIELMVAMSLITSLTVVLLSASISGAESFAFVDATNKENSAMSEVFNRVDRNIRTGIEFPSSYYHYETGESYSATNTTLIIKVRSLRSDGTLCENNFDYVIYQKSGAEFKEFVYADSVSARKTNAQTLMRTVTDPTNFSQLKSSPTANRSITLQLSYKRTIREQTEIKTRTQTMVARNDENSL